MPPTRPQRTPQPRPRDPATRWGRSTVAIVPTMSGPENETLTAALRRLADERASGLLSVATPGRDVVVELDEGAPVAIGPVHDVTDRVGDDAAAGIAAVAVVDELVDRMVAAIVAGDAEWTWDVASEAERVPVPEGLTQELARRAVDAAQALATLDADDVLGPGRAVETSGELDRVRQLFDGERTLEEVAAAADRTLATVATMAAALVAGGAVAMDATTADDEPEPVSWTDTVAATDDEDDDEPELWVMEPPEDEEEVAVPAPQPRPSLRDVAAPGEGAAADDTTATTPPVTPRPEPAGAPTPADAGQDEAAAATPDEPAAAAPADDDAPAASWNDTSWLDDLSTRDEDDGRPVLAAGDDAADALGSMLADLEDEELFGPRSSDDDDDDASEGDGGRTPPLRREPQAEPGDVAEFLRELSRLALDDD